VLSNVIACTTCGELEALKTSGRHIFLIFRPANTFGFQQIRNSGYISWNVVQIIVVHSKVFPSNGSDVIRFRRVRYAEIVGQENTLVNQSRKVRWEERVVK